jgi:hypothetical protein
MFEESPPARAVAYARADGRCEGFDRRSLRNPSLVFE